MGSAQLNDPSSKTIQFNVGGKLYEVSKSLLQAYPTSLLAEKAATEETSPIFIDRDPDRFSLCLDFMRDNGEVFLPESVAKAALLKELDFYSLKPVDGARIHNDESSMRKTAMRIQEVILNAKLRAESHSSKRKVEIEKLALHCFTEFLEHPCKNRKISIKGISAVWLVVVAVKT